MSLALLDVAPAWCLPGAGLDLDFQNNRYWQQGYGNSINSLITTTRASTGYSDDTSGNWILFNNNVPRLTNKGVLVEESRTNVVLWNRDLTNVAWVKSNVTAALTQIGIDGSANSATLLTATAGNGTALQAITLGSSARFQSAFVKRSIGSGTINMTMDNGATWTAITVTAAWTRVTIPTQTLANPTVGFRIVTNGDAVVVDFVQNENGAFTTSPILTTTASVARAADAISVTTPPAFGNASTIFCAGQFNVPSSDGNFHVLAALIGSNNTNRMEAYLSSGTIAAFVDAQASILLNTGMTTYIQGALVKTAISQSSGSQVGVMNGGNIVSNTSATLPIFTGVRIGADDVSNSDTADGYIQRVAVWPTNQLPTPVMQRITI